MKFNQGRKVLKRRKRLSRYGDEKRREKRRRFSYFLIHFNVLYLQTEFIERSAPRINLQAIVGLVDAACGSEAASPSRMGHFFLIPLAFGANERRVYAFADRLRNFFGKFLRRVSSFAADAAGDR